MGTTIHFKGILDREENLFKIIHTATKHCESLGWKFEPITNNANKKDQGIILYPHDECEPLIINFDNKMQISGHIKSVNTPLDVHVEIVKFFLLIKPYFKSLRVDDEAEIWDDYLEHGDKIFQKANRYKEESAEFQIEREVQNGNIERVIDEQGDEHLFAIKTTPEEIDLWFWSATISGGNLHLPTLLNKMRHDLSANRTKPICFPEIVEIAKTQLEFDSFGFYRGQVTLPLKYLAAAWAWEVFPGKPTKVRRNKCISFGWAISDACCDTYAGAINKKHRDAVKLVTYWENDGRNPEETLKILNAILELYKFKS